MLPDNILRQFKKFRRETGIRDAQMDMQLFPDLTLMRHIASPISKPTTATSFHFNYNKSFTPDMNWKYTTIGIIVPSKIELPEWFGIDLGNEETWWIHDTDWDANTTTQSNWQPEWEDSPFLAGFMREWVRRSTGDFSRMRDWERRYSQKHEEKKRYRAHPGAQQDFFEGKWRFSADRAREEVKEQEKWVRAGQKFLAETLVDDTKDKRLLDQMKGYDDPKKED